MPLTLVVRTLSTARRLVCVTYCSMDSTRSRRLDLNAGDNRAVTSRSSATKNSSAAMATGSGRPSTVCADSRPISEVSAGSGRRLGRRDVGGGAVPGERAAARCRSPSGVAGASPKSTVEVAVKGLPFAVPRSVTSSRP